MTTRIEIINRAMARIGNGVIQDETAHDAAPALLVYDSVTSYLLSRYPWTFAGKTRQLGRHSHAPDYYWLYSYQLPGDMLGGPRAAFDRGDCKIPFKDWELVAGRDGEADALVTNAELVWLKYGLSPPPRLWPAYFHELATVALMASYALQVREDMKLYDRLLVHAFGTPGMDGEGGLYGQATSTDSQSKPSSQVAMGNGGPLLNVRSS